MTAAIEEKQYMPLTNEQVVRRWFEEVWNKGDMNAIDELFAADGIAYGLGEAGRDVRGPEAFKQFVQHMRTAFPDLHVTVHDTIVEGDKIAARFSVVMTHMGDVLGLPATGRQVQVNGISFSRVANGQLVEGWNNWDIYGMMQQLNAAPVEATLLTDG
jgi:steroid delta-isomerase-like uncharacterized protein